MQENENVRSLTEDEKRALVSETPTAETAQDSAPRQVEFQEPQRPDHNDYSETEDYSAEATPNYEVEETNKKEGTA